MNDAITFTDQDDLAYLKTLSILYVEDDDSIRSQLTQFLKRRCAMVHTAANGKKGLEAFQRRQPDLVITDILMPVMNGLKMAEAMRASRPKIPIIITTAFEEPRYLEQSIDIGVDKYVVKPINPDVLEKALLKCARAIRAEAALREVEERYLALFKLSQLPMSITSAHNGVPPSLDNLVSFAIEGSHILDCNPAFLALTGYAEPCALQQRTLQDLIKAEFHGKIRQAMLDELLVRGFTRELEVDLLQADGKTVPVMAQFILRRDRAEQPLEMWALMRDVREQRSAEAQLRLAQQVFDHTFDAIVVTDADNNILTVNDAFHRITGYSEEEVLGRNPRLLQSGRHDREFYQAMWQAVQEHGHWQGEVWNRRKSGEIFTEWLSISVVGDGQDRIAKYIGIFSDITKSKAAADYIAFLAHYDPLTRLPNRALLRDRLDQALAAARRQKARIAVMFLDLDRFKNINDSMGHAVGDALLVQVAKQLDRAVREADTVARLGGDEFVVALPNIRQAEDAAAVAQKILDALRELFVLEGREVAVTTSIGIAIYPEDGGDFDTLLKHADTAMYMAKQNGRDNYEFFTPGMNVGTLERLSLEGQLRRALEHGQLELYYQAQVDIASGRLVGAEALLRWRHPDLGLVLPGRFIPLAEESGLIIPIGAWVLREACRQNAEWQRQGLMPISVAVNISAAQFRQRDLRETLSAALQNSGLDACWLELELTESIIMRDAETTIALLHSLKSSGVKLSIDDFGTGYSSLAYLTRFSIDKLKIDQSFVRNLPEDTENSAITRAIISLAHELGIDVIAEGVETRQQLGFLRTQQCDHVQGYLYSEPVCALTMGSMLRQRVITVD